MAGNARFEYPSASELTFAGNYSNGQRGNHSGPNLDRSGSFREGGESRMFGSRVGQSRGSGTLAGDLHPLSECLSLVPVTVGDQKYTSELRRIVGFSVGSTSEDNSFGAAHLKPSPPVAVDDLKRFRSSILDTCTKARGRAKMFDEQLHRLDKHCEAVTFKKQQRNELVTNDRAGGLNLKMGTQIYRNRSDLVIPRVEDQPKNVPLNKRVRTSLAETRAECRNNGLQRQHLVVTKDRDLLKDSGGDSDLFEEKTRRLPAGGDGWDKKRKRTVGPVLTRPIDSDGEQKRAVHNKVNSEPGMQSSDAHTFRSGVSNCTGGTNKLELASLPVSSNARPSPKNEQEGAGLSRDLSSGLNKERVPAKGGNKLNSRDENYITCPSSMTKGNASRTPRTGSIVAPSSSPSIPRVAGTLEGWENAANTNKIPSIGGANNRKRTMSGSSSPPMAQWVGQRPQKISRTRRANLVSPVSNHDERQISPGSCSPSDFSSRLASNGTNGSLLSRNAANGPHQFKVKLENVQSPLRLSESEESGGGEYRLKEKGVGNGEVDVCAAQNVGPSETLAKKNKPLVNEEIGDGVRRQGRSGRGSSISRASISPTREKLDNAAAPKPLRSNRPGSEKNGSKSGRPLKKLSDRKGFSRLGHTQNSGSTDCTGESDDDREELLAAAKFARDASHLACSSSFWKNMEPIFASVSLEDKSYLSQQLNSEQETQKSVPQLLGHGNNVTGDLPHEYTSVSDTLISGERNGRVQHHTRSEDSACAVEDCEVIPLYQRVLSALIVEDNIDEFDETNVGNTRLQDAIYDSAYDTCLLNDAEPRKRSRMEIEYESTLGVHAQSLGAVKKFFACNGSTNSLRSPSFKNSPCDDVHSEVELLAGISKNFLNGPQLLQIESFGISSLDCHSEQMCLDDKLLLELQSIGLYPETVPDLDDKEDEGVKQDIVQLTMRLQQQIGKRKACIDKICKSVGSSPEYRNLKQVAMDRLVELAYKKLLVTRGTSKAGVTKVPKQVALAFARRTLARYEKFEDSGTSCFSEPPLHDVIFASREKVSEPTAPVGRAVANNRYLESRNVQPDPRALSGTFPSSADGGLLNAFGTFNHLSDEAFAINGPISNRGKKKELLLDDVVGSAASRATSHLGISVLGGTKGKRSERDVAARNSVAKAGRASQGSSKGERKTKTKPKQKTAQLPTSGNGIVNKFAETTNTMHPSASGSSHLANNGGNRKRDVRLVSPGNGPVELLKESKEIMDFTNLPLPDLDQIDDLGVSTDLGGEQDLSSLFNFDEDGLQDHYSAGLEIPMDDLSDLNMF